MDITERLRALYVEHGTNYVQEAADEIERLRACFSEGANPAESEWGRKMIARWDGQAKLLRESRAYAELLRSALQSLEQAYSNKHSPQHREACLNEARSALAKNPAECVHETWRDCDCPKMFASCSDEKCPRTDPLRHQSGRDPREAVRELLLDAQSLLDCKTYELAKDAVAGALMKVNEALRPQVCNVPEGWKLVPVKMTTGMLMAGKLTDTVAERYAAQLAAAPDYEFVACTQQEPTP